MGAIVATRAYFIESVLEIIGFKAGLVLSPEEVAELCPEASEIWNGEREETIRIRAEVIGEYVDQILYKIGNIPTPETLPFGLDLYKKYSGQPEVLELLSRIFEAFGRFVDSQKGPIDPGKFLAEVEGTLGPGLPVEIAHAFIMNLVHSMHADPFSNFRIIEWANTAELKSLFSSESLETYYGNFIDQRFVNFLEKNFDSIDQINWRKFEGLVAEYFVSEGFTVEIGPGRNDGNVDIRVWPKKDSKDMPPLVIIQCKRQKTKIEKIVVKALWADVVDENASSGLIVTTSSLSRGAKKVLRARNYPIQEINRQALRKWLDKMKTPFAGFS